jgi:RNA polymerase sigma factor (sigma-70 family)
MDKSEFIKVVNENQAILNKICFGYAKNAEDRHDLQQDILIQIWKAYPKFKHESQLSTWIYRIALNTAISNFRKEKRKIQGSELSHDNYQIPEVHDNAELDGNITVLYQLIYQLNDLEKAIMLLYLDDQSYKKISEIVGITETNVATKISRIKSKLKDQFNKNIL